MQSSKTRILALLKRSGARSVDDLAAALQLAPMTVRQHLTALERDELVSVAERRNGAGRPRHLYSLTERGDAAFPRRYDRFASMLLAELQNLDASPLPSGCPDRMAAVLEHLARQEAEPHRLRLSRLDLPERARETAAVLHEIGGFAEAAERADGIEIRDYNCVYRGLRPAEAGPCAWHARLVPLLLGVPIEITESGEGRRICSVLVPCPTAHTNHRD